MRSIDIARQVAPTDLTVLITGESGTGKEVFPQIIHQLSARKHGPYIAVNCGAIPEGTIDSELFGHEKGSFTGALEARKGYFEEANNGTIFLDEVGELPLSTQVRLLRVEELVRPAIPRRVYTQSHIDYLIEIILEVFKNRNKLKGYNIGYEAPMLRHFTARFETLNNL